MLWAASRPTASPGSHSERCHFSCSRVLKLETGQGTTEVRSRRRPVRALSGRVPTTQNWGAWNYSFSFLGWQLLTSDPLTLKFLVVTLKCPKLPSRSQGGD